jgi:hypothetical protein
VAVKRDAFNAGGLRIETSKDWNGRWFTVWKPHSSIYCRTRKEVLKFAAWPIKTPTGDSLRAWLTSLEEMDKERVSKSAEPLTSEAPIEQTSPSLSQELLATGFGPEVFQEEEDPALSTRMVV